MARTAIGVDSLRSYLGRGLDGIYLPTDWVTVGNGGPGYGTWASPDHRICLSLYWTADDGVIAASDDVSTVYADGWDADSVIRAINDNVTRWLRNVLD